MLYILQVSSPDRENARARASARMHRRAFVRSEAHVSWFSVRLVTGCRLILRLDRPLFLSRFFFWSSLRYPLAARIQAWGSKSNVSFVFFSSSRIFALFLVCKEAARDLWSPRRPSSDLIIRYPASERNRSLSRRSLFFSVLQRSPRRRCDHTRGIQIVSRRFCRVTVVVDFLKSLVMIMYTNRNWNVDLIWYFMRILTL